MKKEFVLLAMIFTVTFSPIQKAQAYGRMLLRRPTEKLQGCRGRASLEKNTCTTI